MEIQSLSEYIIFENIDLIALNKPEGLLSIPDGYNKEIPNLRDILRIEYRQIWVIHRLDKDTSGVIVFAKNAAMHKKLNHAFLNRKVRKKYTAFIHGVPFWHEKVISYPLLVNGDRRHRTIIDTRSGKPAKTVIKIIDKGKYVSKASLWPKTGLTHQIRSHLSHIGHPIIGDKLYDLQRINYFKEVIKFQGFDEGLYFHASELQFLDETIDLPRFVAQIPKKFLTSSI